MSLPKTISQIRNAVPLDLPENHDGVDFLDFCEKIKISPALAEAISAPPVQLHHRPALPGRIAVIGNYLPRRCGIATFTTDLCDAIHAEYGDTELLAVPVNDTPRGLRLPGAQSASNFPRMTCFVSPGSRLPEFQQCGLSVPAARIRHLRRTGGRSHPGTLAPPRHARGHDSAHGAARSESRPARGDGRNCSAIRSPDRYEPAIRRRFCRKYFTFRSPRSIRSPTAFPICRSPIRISTRTPSAPKARKFCSRLACSRQTRASKT